MLAAIRPLSGAPEVTTVTIAADGDEAGEKAAQDAARRFYLEGRKVKIARPPAGMDFNDLLVKPENVVPFPRRQKAAHACLTAPRCNMATASAFHLFDLPASAKAADGLYETKVVEAQEAE